MIASQLPLVYGTRIALLLIANFLMFALFGLHINPLYSLFNGIIMALGLLYALKSLTVDNHIEYYKGFFNSFLIGMNATIIFTVFFALYSGLIEPTYLDTIMEQWHFEAASALIILTVFIMGISTTLMLTLAYMQYFKESWNLKKTSTTINTLS